MTNRSNNHNTPDSAARPVSRGRARGFIAASTLIAVVALGSVAGATVPSQPAVAAEVPNAVTSQTLEKTEFDAWERVRLDFTWAVPDSARAGDTFELALPKELTLPSTASFNLLSPAGDVVAHAVWNGKVATFTLTDYVNDRLAVAGSGYFMIEWDLDATGPNPGQFTLTLGGKLVTVTFPGTGEPGPETKPDPNPWKGGWWQRSDQGVDDPNGALGWVIRLPEDDVNGVPGPITVTDTVGPGQAIDCDTIYASSKLDWHSAVQETELPSTRFSVDSCSAAGFTATLDALLPGEWASIVYTTSVTDPTVTTFTNSAVLSNDTGSVPVDGGLRRDEAGGNGDGVLPVPPTTTPATTTPATTPPSTVPPATPPSSSQTTPAASSTTGTAVLANTGQSPFGLMAVSGVILLLGAIATGAALRFRTGERRAPRS